MLYMNFPSSFDWVLDALTINFQNLLHLLAKYTTQQHFSFLPSLPSKNHHHVSKKLLVTSPNYYNSFGTKSLTI